MKKFLKVAAAVVAVLLLVAIVAPLLLRGKITDIVKREANAALSARLDFEKLDISLLRNFPAASLNLKGLTLVGTERFEGDTIVAARRISVVVDLMSLLGDDGFEVRKVILASPAVHARKLADGAVNWNVMKESGAGDAAEEEDDASGDAAAEPSSFRLSVRSFRIADASIRYEDDSTGITFRTSPLSLELRGDLSASETELDFDLSARGLHFTQGGIPLLNDAEMSLDAEIAADLQHGRFTFSRNTLRLNAIEMRLDGWVQRQDDGLSMDVCAGCSEVRFKELLSLIPAFYTREYRNLTASGDLSMTLWAKGELKGTMLPAFELKTEVRDGSFQYASLPKAVTGINLSASISNPGDVLDRTVVDVSDFRLTMAGQSLAATCRATNLMSDPTLDASVSGRVDLGAVKEVYPLEKGIDLAGQIAASLKLAGSKSDIDRERYEHIAASGTFVVEQLGLNLPGLPGVHIRRAAATVTPQSMTFGELGVTMGRSDLSANGQLTHYLGYLLRGKELSGRLYVKSDLLDLNEIRASLPAEETSGEKPAGDESGKEASGGQVLVVPKNLNLSLNTELKRVLFEGMELSDIAGEMRMSEGTLSLERLNLGLFGGRASASGSYSTAADPAHPALAVNTSIAKASFARTFEQVELVRQLVPLFEKTGGDYSMSLNMKVRLDASMSPDPMTLTADGELRSENISIQQLEVFDRMAEMLHNDALRRIEARDVKIRFSIRDGRVSTEPFDLKMGDITVNLSGSTGLDSSIDYTAKVNLPKQTTGGVLGSINVGIGGTFTAPKLTLGVADAVEQAVSNVISDQVGKLVGEELLSDDAQARADALREEARRAGEQLVAEAEAQSRKLVEAAEKKGALAKIAAEKAGEALVAEAKKQADKLVQEAEKQIDKLSQEKE